MDPVDGDDLCLNVDKGYASLLLLQDFFFFFFLQALTQYTTLSC